MFSHVTDKELVTVKVYCPNSRCDFTMTLRKLCWYLGQIIFLMLLETIHCRLSKLEKNSGFILAHLWFKFLEYFNHNDRLETQIILASRMAFHRPVLNKQEQHTFTSFSNMNKHISYKSYFSTVHFRRITSILQPTNAHTISHKIHF